MESDLKKLHQFGVRLLLLMPDFAESRFSYEFYNKSALRLSAFCNKKQDIFLVLGVSHTRRDFDFCLIVDFWFQYSGMQIETRKLQKLAIIMTYLNPMIIISVGKNGSKRAEKFSGFGIHMALLISLGSVELYRKNFTFLKVQGLHCVRQKKKEWRSQT